MQDANNLKLKGIITWKLRNSDTLCVEEEGTVENLITEYAMRNIVNGGQIGSNIFISSSLAEPNKYINSVPEVIAYGATEIGITTPRFINKTDTVPMHGQWQKRFYPSGSERTINTIGLTATSSGTTATADAYTKLDTACIQGVTQILDIYYRIEFLEDNTFGVADFGIYGMARNAVSNVDAYDPAGVSASYMLGAAGRNDYYTMGYNSTLDENDAWSIRWDSVNTNSVKVFGSISKNSANYRADMSWNIPKSFINDSWPVTGRIYGAMNFQNINNQSLARARVLPSNDPMLQPIFFHNSIATGPFEEVNTLSVGDGTITHSGIWNNDTWPTHYSLLINKTGDTGTSRYSFLNRKFTGWINNTFRTRSVTDAFGSASEIFGVDRDTRTSFPISKHSVVWWHDDRNGKGNVTVINHITGDYDIYNADSAIPLTALNPQQCCGSDNTDSADIWVASPTEGLYKIERPSGNITQIGFAQPHIDASKCYAVTLGKNGRIWAIMEGALVYSDNQGTSFTDLTESTTPSFTIPNISNFNWDQVLYMHADRDTDAANDHQMIIVRSNGTSSASIEKWSLGPSGLGVTSRMRTINVLDPTETDPNKIRQYATGSVNAVTCAHKYGLWQYTDFYANPAYSQSGMYTFGGASLVGYAFYYPKGLGFVYDSYGNPYAVFMNDEGTGSSRRVVTHNQYGVAIGSQVDHTITFLGDYGHAFILDNGIMVHGDKMLALNSMDSEFGHSIENTIADHYGYNDTSSSWELNYYGTPIVNNVGSLEMRRSNFDVNSWNFDGISTYIDVQQKDYYEVDGVNAWALTVSSNQIADGNTKTVMSMNAPKFEFNWMDSSDVNQMSIVCGASTLGTGAKIMLGARPIDNNEHRLFFIVDSTNNYMTVYLDGSIILNNYSLGGAYKFGNYSRLVLGNNTYRGPLNYFKGTVRNFCMYKGSLAVSDAMVQLDYTNHVNLPNSNVTDIGVTAQRDYLDANGDFVKAVGAYTSYDAPTKTVNANGSSYDKYLKVIDRVRDRDGLDSTRLNFKIKSVSQTSVGFDSDSSPQNTSAPIKDQIGICLVVQNSSSALVYLEGVLLATLPAWTTDTEFGIELDGHTFNVYVDNVLAHSEPNVKTTELAHSIFFTCHYYDVMAVEILSLTSTQTMSTSMVHGHWPMNDSVPKTNTKLTHTAEEALVDGINIKFEDTVDATFNWFNGDRYTFAACDGFLKDNIRTFAGAYSLYWKPTRSNETEVSPVTIVSNSTIPGSISGNSYAAYSVAIGNQGSGTGAFHPKFVYMETFNRERMLQVFLNGTEVTEYLEDHSSTGVDNLIQSGTAITYSSSNTTDGFRLRANMGDQIWLRLEDGSIHLSTIVSFSAINSNIVNIADAVPGINPFRPEGVIWVQNSNLVQGEVAFNRFLGIFRFHSSDAGKIVTARYTYLHDV